MTQSVSLNKTNAVAMSDKMITNACMFGMLFFFISPKKKSRLPVR